MKGSSISPLRGALMLIVALFFLFPLFWIVLMSFETNTDILRSPPQLFFTPTLHNYLALISGKLGGGTGTMTVNYMQNLLNSVILSTCSVVVSLILGVPAAYAFARFKFRGGEDIAFTLLSFRFAPPLLVLLPLLNYFQMIGLYDTYIGLIWVYQLITLPLVLWIVRGYFEDVSEDIELAYRLDGHSWLSTFFKIAIPGSSSIQPVTVGALAFITSSGIEYGQIAAALVLSVIPTLVLAIFTQRYLVEGLSLGAIKG
jgi:multiple sugar transport system permease protein